MEHLTELVAKKANISEEQARTAIDTVLSFAKERLPQPIAENLESILEGADGFDLDKGLDMLGGLFGQK